MNLVKAPAAQRGTARANQYAPTISKTFQNTFGGLNHTAACGDGQLYDMKNIGSLEYPVLEPRKPRRKSYKWITERTFEFSDGTTERKRPDIYDIFANDSLWTIEDVWKAEGTDLIPDSEYYALHVNVQDSLGDISLTTDNNGNLATIGFIKRGPTGDYILKKKSLSEMDAVTMGKYLVMNNGLVARNDCVGYFSALSVVRSSISYPDEGTVVAVAVENTGSHDNYDDPEGREVSYQYYAYNIGKWEAVGMPVRPEKRRKVLGVTFCDGTLKDAAATMNTMKLNENSAITWPDWMKPGDTIRIASTQELKEQNKGWHTIREISDDRKKLRFDENSFEAEDAEKIVSVDMFPPDMDFICALNNRVFGCKNDTIYASSLGDPYNWWTYDALSTDAYSVDVGSAGDFTGCAAYDGDVYFFKENCFYRLYNTSRAPSKWQLTEYNYPGIKKGSNRSAAVAGNAIYWLSNKGVMRFAGSRPVSVQQPLGINLPQHGVGGSDMEDYYAELDGTVYQYDTSVGAWFKEDQMDIARFAYESGKLYAAAAKNDNHTVLEINAESAEDGDTIWNGDGETILEFGDMQLQAADHKMQTRLFVTASVGTGGKLEVYYSYDGDIYEKAGEIKTGAKREEAMSFPPHRNDFCRIKIVGRGNWKLWNLTTGKQLATEFG